MAERNHWTREKKKATGMNIKNRQMNFFYKWNTTYPGINYIVNDAPMPDGKQLWFRVEVEHRLFAGFCVFDPNAESEEGHGDQVDEYDACNCKSSRALSENQCGRPQGLVGNQVVSASRRNRSRMIQFRTLKS